MLPDRLETLLHFYRDDPGDAFTRFAIAQEYRKRGETEQAIGFFEALVQEQPAYVGTYYHLGKLYEEVGRKADALQTYRRGIAVATNQRDLHARAELQNALLEAEGVGFDDEE